MSATSATPPLTATSATATESPNPLEAMYSTQKVAEYFASRAIPGQVIVVILDAVFEAQPSIPKLADYRCVKDIPVEAFLRASGPPSEPILSQWYFIVIAHTLVHHTAVPWGYIRAYDLWRRCRLGRRDDGFTLYRDACTLTDQPPVYHYTYPPRYDMEVNFDFQSLCIPTRQCVDDIETMSITMVRKHLQLQRKEPFMEKYPTETQQAWDAFAVLVLAVCVRLQPDALDFETRWRKAEARRLIDHLFADQPTWEAYLQHCGCELIATGTLPESLRTYLQRYDQHVGWWIRVPDCFACPFLVGKRIGVLRGGELYLPSYEVHPTFLPQRWHFFPRDALTDEYRDRLLDTRIPKVVIPLLRQFIGLPDPSHAFDTSLAAMQATGLKSMQELKAAHVLPRCVEELDNRTSLSNLERVFYGHMVVHRLGMRIGAVMQRWRPRIAIAYDEPAKKDGEETMHVREYRATFEMAKKYPSISHCRWIMEKKLCPYLQQQKTLPKNRQAAGRQCAQALLKPEVVEITSAWQFIQMQLDALKENPSSVPLKVPVPKPSSVPVAVTPPAAALPLPLARFRVRVATPVVTVPAMAPLGEGSIVPMERVLAASSPPPPLPPADLPLPLPSQGNPWQRRLQQLAKRKLSNDV